MSRRVLFLLAGIFLVLGATVPIHSPTKALAGPEEKVTGQLAQYLDAVKSPQGTNAMIGANGDTNMMLSRGAGSLQIDQAGNILVNIRVTSSSSQSTIAALTGAGARIDQPTWIGRGVTEGTITAFVSPANLNAVAALPQVLSIVDAPRPALNRMDTPSIAPAGPAVGSCSAPSGNVISEGNVQLNADAARTTYSVTGAGVLVGVQSDSYNAFDSTATPGPDFPAATTPAQDITSDDLPGPGNPCPWTTANNILADCPANSGCLDEGRAMMQIIHDLSPGSPLAFASPVSSTDFANRMTTMAGLTNAKVFSDDLSFFDQPSYQESPIGVAAGANTNVLSFTAAGDSRGTDAGVNWNGYETLAYRPMACPSGVPLGYTDCHDFGPAGTPDATYGFNAALTPNDIQPILQWAEPWNGVTDNLDFFLGNATGTTVSGVCLGTQNNITSQRPWESFDCLSGTAARSLIVARKAGSVGTPRFKIMFWRTGNESAIEHASAATLATGDTVGHQVMFHQCSQNFLSLGATPATGGGAGTALESYSSFGPCTFLFGPVNGVLIAPTLGSPLTVNKPDVVATDCNLTTFFLSAAAPHQFCGTSAASPHAAAVAALLNAFVPTLTPAQVRTAILGNTTFMAGTTNQVGAGLVNALAALGSVAPAVSTAPTVTTPTKTAITHNSATLGANVTSDGGSAVTERGIVYSQTSVNADPTTATGTKVIVGSGTGVFTTNVTGLTPSTGYSYKGYAINSIGTSYTTPADTFTTLPPPIVPPTVTTPTKTAITQTGATLGGNVTADGGAPVTGRGVVVAPTASNPNPTVGGPGGVLNFPAASGGLGVFTINATGLTPNTAYSYRAYGTNSSGSGYTTPADTFNTLPLVAPTISKVFTPNIINVGGKSVLSFTLTNSNPVALTGVGFTDALPGIGSPGGGIVLATPPNPSSATPCGGALTAVSGSASIALTGGSLPANGNCTFSIEVFGFRPGVVNNTSSGVSSAQAPTGAGAAATLTVNPPLGKGLTEIIPSIQAPVLTKNFGANATPFLPLNTPTSLQFTIKNNNTLFALSGMSFTDNLPGGMIVSTPNALVNNCGGTVTAVPGTSVITVTGAMLGSGPTTTSCTITLNVQGPVAGSYTNNTTPIASVEGGSGTAASAIITIGQVAKKGL